jgi:hypothetical protein
LIHHAAKPPLAGLASSSIAQLKQETMNFMTNFMRQKNMSMEEGEWHAYLLRCRRCPVRCLKAAPSMVPIQLLTAAVDLMEEVVASDDEQKGSMQPGKKAKGQAGQKRKQQQTAAKA